jgi:hypothetical protein
MRSIVWTATGAVAAALVGAVFQASAAGPSCTGGDAHGPPRCRATWEDEKRKSTDYAIRCEYACARGRDSWHAPEPECRCRPPCGQVYVKKRLYKSEGKETVERVPKYEVEKAPQQPCGCAACVAGRAHGWSAFGILTFLHPR